MSEPGTGEFPPEEQLAEQKKAYYESQIPDEEKRAALESANIASQVSEVLWIHKNNPDDEDFPPEVVEDVKKKVGEIQKALDVDELSEEDKEDQQKIAEWQQKQETSAKARTIFGELILEKFATTPTEVQPSEDEKKEKLEEIIQNQPAEEREAVQKITEAAKLLQKESVTVEDIEEFKQKFHGSNREEVKPFIEMGNLSDAQKEELLQSFEEQTEEERSETETNGEPVDEDMRTQLDEASDQLTAKRGELEMSDMPEDQKRTFRAKLRVLNNRLEEMKVKKIARGVGKGLVISAIALALIFIWELQLFGKMSKKK